MTGRIGVPEAGLLAGAVATLPYWLPILAGKLILW